MGCCGQAVKTIGSLVSSMSLKLGKTKMYVCMYLSIYGHKLVPRQCTKTPPHFLLNTPSPKYYGYTHGRPGSSEVPRNPLTRWDVSSIPANGIFLTKKLKN